MSSGFNLGSAVNGAADWVSGAPIIRGVVSNPVFTALLITALAAIVVMGVYHYQIKRAGAKSAVRAALYVFILVTAVTFVHHVAVTRMAGETVHQKGVRDVFSSIQQSRDVGALDTVPVYPMGYDGARAVGGAAGGDEPDCGCPLAPRAGGLRADNVAVSALTIEDVVVPAAASPFR